MITICPKCKAKYNIQAQHIGISHKCKYCNETFIMKEATEVEITKKPGASNLDKTLLPQGQPYGGSPGNTGGVPPLPPQKLDIYSQPTTGVPIPPAGGTTNQTDPTLTLPPLLPANSTHIGGTLPQQPTDPTQFGTAPPLPGGSFQPQQLPMIQPPMGSNIPQNVMGLPLPNQFQQKKEYKEIGGNSTILLWGLLIVAWGFVPLIGYLTNGDLEMFLLGNSQLITYFFILFLLILFACTVATVIQQLLRIQQYLKKIMLK
jgi:predicted Zn finger-like uncharacterized protein